ncbi:MAG: hypothetical protein EXQ84_05595 [Rhodospirillaceae bacterium]|nr:hypothetical protein [Rhodospirillaceae bacterium]
MASLVDIIDAESRRETFPAAGAFADELRRHYGEATAAVLFYGSCLRENTDAGLMLDFYVLVDRYRHALGHPLSAAFAALLPPNVYYHEMVFEGRTVRTKVAVMSLAQFLRGASPDAFTASVWARFAQPARILIAKNNEVRRRVADALAQAVRTMIACTTPLMDAGFTARELWLRAKLPRVTPPSCVLNRTRNARPWSRAIWRALRP